MNNSWGRSPSQVETNGNSYLRDLFSRMGVDSYRDRAKGPEGWVMAAIGCSL